MAQTYCGKDCSACTYKEQMSCPGCKMGPGQQINGDCELAKCCRSKGHISCSDCTLASTCGLIHSCDKMPEARRRKHLLEAERKARLAERAPVLGKYIWILFWLVIPSTLSSLLTNGNMPQSSDMFGFGQLLGIACSVVYGVILLRLSSIEEQYFKAGICNLAVAGGSVLMGILRDSSAGAMLTLLLLLASAVVSLIGQYNEYMAHATVLYDVDKDLQAKWEKLWYWNIGCLVALVVSVIVTAIIPLIGALAVLAIGIAMIVIGILRLVYLYKTASLFRRL